MKLVQLNRIKWTKGKEENTIEITIIAQVEQGASPIQFNSIHVFIGKEAKCLKYNP